MITKIWKDDKGQQLLQIWKYDTSFYLAWTRYNILSHLIDFNVVNAMLKELWTSLLRWSFLHDYLKMWIRYIFSKKKVLHLITLNSFNFFTVFVSGSSSSDRVWWEKWSNRETSLLASRIQGTNPPWYRQLYSSWSCKEPSSAILCKQGCRYESSQ